jgi:hypothetical protein
VAKQSCVNTTSVYYIDEVRAFKQVFLSFKQTDTNNSAKTELYATNITLSRIKTSKQIYMTKTCANTTSVNHDGIPMHYNLYICEKHKYAKCINKTLKQNGNTTPVLFAS